MSSALRRLRDRLLAALGDDGYRDGPEDLAVYGTDRCRGPWTPRGACVAFPRTVDEVRDIVRACAELRVPIVPSGGRTGLTGAATAIGHELVLSMERMRRILWVDGPTRMLACEAGATVEAVQHAAKDVGLIYPVDFAAKGSAQVGGSIATNAGGVKVLRYGSTRAWVNGLKVVVASGALLDLGGTLVKDNTGYDLRQLFIGSEGTLGVVVEATLRLTSAPANLAVALCAVPDERAILQLFERCQRVLGLQAFECFDHVCLQHVLAARGQVGGPFPAPSHAYVLIESEVALAGDEGASLARKQLTEVLESAAADGEIEDGVIATSQEQAAGLWSLREDISESLHRQRPHKSDISLPIAKIPDFLVRWRQQVAADLPGAISLVFGHIGDGNLHLNVVPPSGRESHRLTDSFTAYDRATYALVHELGGSVSAEHGIGLLKRDYLDLSRGTEQVELMRAIKRALDPHGLFNPGKILA